MKKNHKSKQPARKVAEKPLRRTPKQARGQLRVDEILDATERLLQTTNWDKLSTNHIAKEAEIPIGSLYQFFANKQAIAHALVERYMVGIEQAFATLPSQLEILPPAEIINAIFDRLLRLAQEHSGLHAVLITLNDGSELGKISVPIRELLCAKIEQILAVRAPWLSAEERRLHAIVSHVTNRAIFAQAISFAAQGDGVTAQQLLQQARQMQTAYYNHLLQAHEARILQP